MERVRAIIAWKCGGLDAGGVRATLPPSTLTLGGLLEHLAAVEDEYFTHRLLGEELGPPWDAVDWDADPNWEWRTGAEDPPEEVMALRREATNRSRASVATALAGGGGLDQKVKQSPHDGELPTLRRVVIDMIEEYARHAGHVDLIRESVDGLVGEGPPG